jgi:hypothetical protein
MVRIVMKTKWPSLVPESGTILIRLRCLSKQPNAAKEGKAQKDRKAYLVAQGEMGQSGPRFGASVSAS